MKYKLYNIASKKVTSGEKLKHDKHILKDKKVGLE